MGAPWPRNAAVAWTPSVVLGMRGWGSSAAEGASAVLATLAAAGRRLRLRSPTVSPGNPIMSTSAGRTLMLAGKAATTSLVESTTAGLRSAASWFDRFRQRWKEGLAGAFGGRGRTRSGGRVHQIGRAARGGRVYGACARPRCRNNCARGGGFQTCQQPFGSRSPLMVALCVLVGVWHRGQAWSKRNNGNTARRSAQPAAQAASERVCARAKKA